MLSYIVRRLLATIPVMAVVALFVFSLLYVAPGDPAAVIAGDQASPEDVARIRQSLGLDRPFLIRFGEWVWQILHGDLGTYSPKRMRNGRSRPRLWRMRATS